MPAGQLEYNEEPEGEVLTFSEKVKTYVDGVIDNQKYMFSYHSGLNSTHPYQSAWYEWPLGNRPVWFYSGGSESGHNKVRNHFNFRQPRSMVDLLCRHVDAVHHVPAQQVQAQCGDILHLCLHGIVHAALDADFPLCVRISLLCDRADDNTCLCICAQAL